MSGDEDAAAAGPSPRVNAPLPTSPTANLTASTSTKNVLSPLVSNTPVAFSPNAAAITANKNDGVVRKGSFGGFTASANNVLDIAITIDAGFANSTAGTPNNNSNNATNITPISGSRQSLKRTNERAMAKQQRIIFEQALNRKVEDATSMVTRARWLLNMLTNKQLAEEDSKRLSKTGGGFTRMFSTDVGDDGLGSVGAGSANSDTGFGDDKRDGEELLAPPNAEPDAWKFAYENAEYYYVEGKRIGKKVILSNIEEARHGSSPGSRVGTAGLVQSNILHHLSQDQGDIDDEALAYDGVNTARGGVTTQTSQRPGSSGVRPGTGHRPNSSGFHSSQPSQRPSSSGMHSLQASQRPSSSGTPDLQPGGQRPSSSGIQPPFGSLSRQSSQRMSSPAAPSPAFLQRQSSASRLTDQLTRTPSANRKSVFVAQQQQQPGSTDSPARNSGIGASLASPGTPSRGSSFRGLGQRQPSFVTRNGLRSADGQPQGQGSAGNTAQGQGVSSGATVAGSTVAGGATVQSNAPKVRTPSRPIDQYEYLEEYEGVGAHTLLGILDFVLAGEVAGLCDEDRRNWKDFADPSPPPSPLAASPLPADGLLASDAVALDSATSAPVAASDAGSITGSRVGGDNDAASVAKSTATGSDGDNNSQISRTSSSQRRTLFSEDQLPISRLASGGSLESKSMSHKRHTAEEDEFELEKRLRKEHRKALRETRKENEKKMHEARTKIKTWYEVISAVRNASAGPGTLIFAVLYIGE
jgi:hypothetical protein